MRYFKKLKILLVFWSKALYLLTKNFERIEQIGTIYISFHFIRLSRKIYDFLSATERCSHGKNARFTYQRT